MLYIAMAHIDGSDLKALLVAEGRLPLRRALRIARQIASALDAAHARGLVHRDVKPANILVGADDRAFLSDFGVVKELAAAGTDAHRRLRRHDRVLRAGADRGRDVDARADVYALACVLYECLVGTSPFHRSSEVAVLNAHLHAPPPQLLEGGAGPAARARPRAREGALEVAARPLRNLRRARRSARAAAVPEPRVHSRRLVVSLALLAGAALGARRSRSALVPRGFGHEPAPRATTVVERQPPSQSPVALDTLLLKSTDGRTLNDAAFFLITAKRVRAGDPVRAAGGRDAKQAHAHLRLRDVQPGLALLKLGQCTEALPLLRRALEIEPPAQAHFIRPRITQAKTLRRSPEHPVERRSRSSAGRADPSRAP